jgi:hypothetical protein
MANMPKMAVTLGALFVVSQMDKEDPTTIFWAQCFFVASCIISLATQAYVYLRIVAKKDGRDVHVPEEEPGFGMPKPTGYVRESSWSCTTWVSALVAHRSVCEHVCPFSSNSIVHVHVHVHVHVCWCIISPV